MSNGVQRTVRGEGREAEPAAQRLGQAMGGWSPSRRGFLGLIAATPLAVACSPEGGGPGGVGGVPNPGTLVIVMDDQPLTMDPAGVNPEEVGANYAFNVYDRLVDIPADSAELAPSLATEVPSIDNGQVSEDGLVYTFKLREGVKFHDGTDLNAEAVKFSWDRVVTMALPEGQSHIFANVASTRVVDDMTFEVTLKKPESAFLRTTAAAVAASVVSPAAVEANGGVVAGQPNEWMAQNVAGTGPYTLKEWVRGDHATYDIYEDYWGEPAFLPVQIHLLVKEMATRMRAKGADMMNGTADRAPKVENIDFITIDADTLGMQLNEIGFNMKIDPTTLPEGDDIPADFFHDPRVRQAFNYSFPYDTYISGVLQDYAERTNFVIPKGMAGYDPDAGTYPTDPAKAEQLFREAGWWDRGFTVSLVADGTHGAFNGAALAMKDGIEKLNPNFHVQVLSLPEAQSDQMLNEDPIPAAMWSYTSPPLTAPAEYAWDQAHPDGTWGAKAGFRNGYSDPDHVAAICDEAATTVDEERRMEIYTELQTIQYEEAMWVITCQEALPLIYGDWMENIVANPLWPRPSFRWSLYQKSSGGGSS